MSSDYRLNLIWTSHGSQLRADIERNMAGLTGFDRQIQQHNRNLGLWGQQMRAMGTTLRYALAGATVYSIAGAVGGLGQFLDRLGEIDALAAQMDSNGRLVSLGRNLNALGDTAIQLSNKWGIAVDDIEQHMARFYSSFTPKGNQQRGVEQAIGWADQMSTLTMALGSEAGDPTALSGGVAGFIQGMGPSAVNNPVAAARRLSSIIAEVIAKTPNILGTDIARDIGRLGGAQVSLRMTPEQIFSVYGTAARAGGSSAVIGRGITQLLTAELVNPQTDKQKQAFRKMGLPADPGSLREMGGWKILTHLLGRFDRPDPRAQAALSGIDDPQEALAASGIPKKSVNTLFEMFGRMESARQFMNLLAVGGKDALQDFIDGMKDATDSNRAKQMADIRNEQRAYQQLSQVTKNVGLTIARGYDPFTRPAAVQINRAGRWVSGQDPRVVAGVATGGAATAVAARLIFGMGLTGLAGKGLGKIPGVGGMMNKMGLGKLLGRAPQLSAAALVGSGLGAFQATGEGAQRSGSRSNPYWVVVDPLSWFMPGAPSGMGGGKDDKTPNTFKVPGWLKGAGAMGALRVSGVGALAATPAIAAYEVKKHNDAFDRRQRYDPQRQRALTYALQTDAGAFRATGDERRILNLYRAKKINAPQADARLRQLEDFQRMFGGGGGGGKGGAQALTIEGGTTIRFVSTPALDKLLKISEREPFMPVKLVTVGQGGNRPSFRGQKKTQRRGGQ